MHGPQPKPPTYEKVALASEKAPTRLDSTVPNPHAKSELSVAAAEWYRLARGEFNTISQDNLEYRESRFAWRSAASAVASPWGAATCVSAVWRGLAKRAFETAAITARPQADTAQHRVVEMHARATTNAIELVPKSASEELEQNFKNFAKAFRDAIDAKSRPWLLSLCNLAKKKTEIIATAVLAMRRAHWKQVIGITIEAGSIRAPRPTKAAYRYARGTE